MQNKQAENRAVNSYDAFKCIALILMVIDHFGFYFFPKIIELRIIGRLSFPIFFFLIGYSKSTHFDKFLLISALAISATDYLLKYPVFAVNILYCVLIVRLIFSYLHKTKFIQEKPWQMLSLLAVFYLPTMLLFDYGTVCLMFAASGYLLRIQPTSQNGRIFLLLSGSFHYITQAYIFQLDAVNAALFALIFAPLLVLLANFRINDLPKNYYLAKNIIRIIARNSLIIYAIHLILFKLAAKLF